LQDAVALLCLDDLYIELFKVIDIKILHSGYLSCAVSSTIGYDSKTWFAIENTTRMQVVIADIQIYLLESYANICFARNVFMILWGLFLVRFIIAWKML